MVEQFNREFGERLEGEEFETIGGMILFACGELPSKGTAILIEGIEFIVVEVENNRIQEVIAKRTKSTEEGPKGRHPPTSDRGEATPSLENGGKSENGMPAERGQS